MNCEGYAGSLSTIRRPAKYATPDISEFNTILIVFHAAAMYNSGVMQDTAIMRVKVSDKPDAGAVHFEVTQIGPIQGGNRDQDVSRADFHLDQICDTISQVAQTIGKGLEELKAKRTVVEFGVEIGAESGHLTAMIVKGTGKANLKVTVEWS